MNNSEQLSAVSADVLRTAVEILTAHHHLPPVQRLSVTRRALEDIEPILVVTALSTFALAFMARYAELTGADTGELLALTGADIVWRSVHAPLDT